MKNVIVKVILQFKLFHSSIKLFVFPMRKILCHIYFKQFHINRQLSTHTKKKQRDKHNAKHKHININHNMNRGKVRKTDSNNMISYTTFLPSPNLLWVFCLLWCNAMQCNVLVQGIISLRFHVSCSNCLGMAAFHRFWSKVSIQLIHTLATLLSVEKPSLNQISKLLWVLNKSFSVYFKLYISERVGLVWGQKIQFNMGKSIKSGRIIAVRKQRKARNFQDFKN